MNANVQHEMKKKVAYLRESLRPIVLALQRNSIISQRHKPQVYFTPKYTRLWSIANEQRWSDADDNAGQVAYQSQVTIVSKKQAVIPKSRGYSQCLRWSDTDDARHIVSQESKLEHTAQKQRLELL